MKLPKTIKVGPHKYPVVRLPANAMGDLLGEFDPNEGVIKLKTKLRTDKLQEILLHEIVHACFYPALLDSNMDEEQFVDGVTPNLLQVIQDNPELLEYLCHIKVKPKKLTSTPTELSSKSKE